MSLAFRVAPLAAVAVFLMAVAVSASPADAPLPPDAPPTDGSHQPVAWRAGPNRPFAATRTDLGFLFFRPRFSVGYGKPHHLWAGADLNPTVSSHSIGGYFGGRLAHPNVNLRVGARYGYAYSRAFLKPRSSYDHLDLDALDGPQARFLSWESELSYSIPFAGGHLVGELAGTIVTLVPRGYYVFEDTLNLVAAPPYVFRKRVGYSWAFGFERAFRLSLVGEVVSIPRREAWIYRAGLTASVRISDALAVRMIAIPVVASPDAIGAIGSDFFLVGIRHYWATAL